MQMGAPSVQLAIKLIEEYHGPVIKVVTEYLLKYGAKTCKEIFMAVSNMFGDHILRNLQ